MFRWIKDVWMGSEPVEFVSSFDMAESVERLRAATRRWALPFATQECAAGTVKQGRVALQRVIPMVGNSFKPFFIGRFEQRQGKVVLTGRFTMLLFVKLFMAVWFGGLACMTVAGLVASLSSRKAAMLPVATIGMMAFGVGLVALGQRFTRNDPAWLSDVMRGALEAQPDINAPARSAVDASNASAGKTPAFILVMTGLFTLIGIAWLVSAITDIQGYYGVPGNSVTVAYTSQILRFLTGACAIVMLGLAYGIYRRRRYAWRGVFVLLVGSPVFQWVYLPSLEQLRNARIPMIVFGCFSLLVAAAWGRWWYAQRAHFKA